MGENIDRVKQRLDLAIDKRRRLALGPGKPLGLDLPGRIHGVSPAQSIFLKLTNADERKANALHYSAKAYLLIPGCNVFFK